MIGNVVNWLYKTWIYPRLLDYVNKTDNTWDNSVLAFVDEVVEIVIKKLGDVEEIKKEIKAKIELDLDKHA